MESFLNWSAEAGAEPRTLTVAGGRTLSGRIRIQGSKNAVHKLLAASIVFPGIHLLQNFPRIKDAFGLLDILEFVGARVSFVEPHTVQIDTRYVEPRAILGELASQSTGTFLFAGALLTRFGEAQVAHPGGDSIGARPVDRHLRAFEALGARTDVEGGLYSVRAVRLRGGDVSFEKQTVNGTANALLAASRAEGITRIHNASRDPDVDNLINFLMSAGARIDATNGGRSLSIEGVREGADRTETAVAPDRNDAATFMIAGALCGGEVVLERVRVSQLGPLVQALRRVGITCDTRRRTDGDDDCAVRASELVGPGLTIVSRPYPGFASDWGPMIQVLMTQVPGRSVFHETVFSARFQHVGELRRLGADIHVRRATDQSRKSYDFDERTSSGEIAEIGGPTVLGGGTVRAANVRSGAALALAALVSAGSVEIENVRYLVHGYERFVERLRGLGASVDEAY
jgi:UDP-N-acetylglucosamine 1-carboxyvinyltransferase